MKKISVLIVVLFAIQTYYSNSYKNKVKNVEVAYIANEGFLIKAGNKKY